MRRRWIVKLTDRTDERRRLEIFQTVAGFETGNPATFGFVPARCGQPRIETDMAADVVLDRDLLEVGEQFFAWREITGPLVSGAERVRIGVIGRIHAAAGIAIDVPGAAELVVFLDNGVGNAEPAEGDPQGDRADARADDKHMLRRQGIAGRAPGPPHIARNESHFLAHQRRIFRRDVLAETGPHHLQHQFVAGIGDRGLGLAIFEKLEDGCADFVLDLLRHPGFRIGDKADIALRLVRRFQPALVAGHVNQYHQQDADVAFGDSRRQIEGLSRHLDVHRLRSRHHSNTISGHRRCLWRAG